MNQRIKMRIIILFPSSTSALHTRASVSGGRLDRLCSECIESCRHFLSSSRWRCEIHRICPTCARRRLRRSGPRGSRTSRTPGRNRTLHKDRNEKVLTLEDSTTCMYQCIRTNSIFRIIDICSNLCMYTLHSTSIDSLLLAAQHTGSVDQGDVAQYWAR